MDAEKQLELNRRLLEASRDWDMPLIQECIENGADVNFLENGETPLLNAVSYFDFKGIDQKTNERIIPKIELEKNCIQVVDLLLKNGADINLNNGEDYPLMEVVYNNSTNVLRYFLENGANPNFVCYPEESPNIYSSPVDYYDDMIYEDYDNAAREQHNLLRQFGGRRYHYNYEPNTWTYLDKYFVRMTPGYESGKIFFDNGDWCIGTDKYINIEDENAKITTIDISPLSFRLKEWNAEYISNSKNANDFFDWKRWREDGQILAQEILKICDDKIALFYQYDKKDSVRITI